ncbi:MAG: glycoside hydrolase family 11 protein [Oscillospiraceae bacterium]|nr:glycoside hydrolase family 11 protein [Oscillospiraceae bacterium]
MKKRVLTIGLALILLAAAIPASAAESVVLEASNGTSRRTFTTAGYDYELWSQDGIGVAKMTVTGDAEKGGTFDAEWDKTLNILFRAGKRFTTTRGMDLANPSQKGKTYKEHGNISIDFEASWSTNDGASYISMYGWGFYEDASIPKLSHDGKTEIKFTNQIEFYIIKDRKSYNPGRAAGTKKGEASIDGIVFEFYESDRIGEHSIQGSSTNFKQYWSIPKNTSDHSLNGIISVSKHFEEWEKAGMIMDGPIYEVTMKAESYTANKNSKGTASITKNILTIGEPEYIPEGIDIPDPNFYAAVLEVLDKPTGYVITAEDVDWITSLNVSKKDIKSLVGIEHFTALKYFSCDENQLTELDISKNTMLEWLQCKSNQLTTLDISNNTALEHLYCYDNKLTKLDLSHNTALEWLTVSYNQLTTLDISNNTALESFFCYGNKLTKLDVSNNTALTIIACGGNYLTELDVSNIIALDTLTCAENYFPSKDAIIGLDESKLNSLTFEPQKDTIETASPWAKPVINAAIGYGIVPVPLQTGYDQPATRAEFCALAVALIETLTGEEITARREFSDDKGDVNVQKIGGMEIVYGVSADKFEPGEGIKRQEAAMILDRIARKAFSETLPEGQITFTDLAGVPDDMINAIKRLRGVRPGIMTGISATSFDPSGSFTLEQSIQTMVKLYERFQP